MSDIRDVFDFVGEALLPLQHAERLRPGSVYVMLELGQARAGLLDFDAANDWYARAVAVDPANQDAWYGLGVTYLCVQRTFIRRMRQIEPSGARRREILHSLGVTPNATRSDFLNAKRVFERQQDNAVAVARVIELAGRLGVSSLCEVASTGQDSERIRLAEAEAMQIGEQYKQAEATAKNLLVEDPGNPQAALVLATIYWKMGRVDKVPLLINIVLKKNPNDAEAAFIMGYILSAQGKEEEAKPYLLNATESRAGIAPHAYGLLGQVYAKEGRVSDAIIALKKALPVDRDGRYRYQLSRLYAQLGDTQKSQKWLNESEEVNAAMHREEQESFESLAGDSSTR
jgi:tetratricopeptide (TPR) repeat protein